MGLLKKLLGLESSRPLPVSVNDDNLESEVFGSDLPVVLDAWSPGCAPCKQLEGIVLGLVKRYAGRVKVAETNIAEAPRAVRRLGVRGTPTVMYFRSGREVERVVGFRGELYHQQTVDAVLLGEPAQG